jgi:hypothetical protein
MKRSSLMGVLASTDLTRERKGAQSVARLHEWRWLSSESSVMNFAVAHSAYRTPSSSNPMALVAGSHPGMGRLNMTFHWPLYYVSGASWLVSKHVHGLPSSWPWFVSSMCSEGAMSRETEQRRMAAYPVSGVFISDWPSNVRETDFRRTRAVRRVEKKE